MVFGHNTNVKAGSHTFHVQTEDRGASHALIDTTVYFQGRVLHRRTNNYLDLLPLNEDSQQALKMRVDEQHRLVLEEIRSGVLPLPIPPGTQAMENAKSEHTPQQTQSTHPKPEHSPKPQVPSRKLLIELLNARSWLVGKQATLHVAVQEEGGGPIPGAHVTAEIEGGAEQSVYSSQTGTTGRATLAFEMPKLASADAALVIRLENSNGTPPLRYALRAKPRVPTA
jgi:hypothetical protein